MNRTIIISGGNIDDDFALRFCEEHPYRFLIAADRGLLFLDRAGIVPTHIVGDFDSAGTAALSDYEKKHPGIEVRRFRPQKDDTDTSIALHLALELKSDEIWLLGCTGTRLDHVAASVRDMRCALSAGVPCFLVDPHNRIRLTERGIRIKKEEQYGKYVSLFPADGPVRGLTLTGFAYPLDHRDLPGLSALGVSNEITEAEGVITFEEGILAVIESRD